MADQNLKKNNTSSPAKAGKSTPKKASSIPTQSNTSTPAKARRSTPKKTSATSTQSNMSAPVQVGPSTQSQGSATQAPTTSSPATVQVVLDAHTEPYQGTRPIPNDLQKFANKVNTALRDPANVRKLDPNPPKARAWLLEFDDLSLFLAKNGYLGGSSTIWRFWMDERLFTKWVWRNLATSEQRPGSKPKELSSNTKGLVTAPAVVRPGDPQRPSIWAAGDITADHGNPTVQLPNLVGVAGSGVVARNSANNTPTASATSTAATTSSKRKVSKSGKKADVEQEHEEEEEEEKEPEEEEEEEEEHEENEDEPQGSSASADINASTKNADRGPSDSETDKPAPKKQKSLGKQKGASAEMAEADEPELSEGEEARMGDPMIPDSPLSEHDKAMLPAFGRAIERKIEREAKEEKVKAEKAKPAGKKKGKQ